MASSSRKIMVLLSAILVAAVITSIVVLFVLPGDGPSLKIPQLGSLQDNIFRDQTPTPTPQAGAAPAGFNTDVLSRPGYSTTNDTLINNGLLPVKPASNPGKANPFL